jgi:hypothetical protein
MVGPGPYDAYLRTRPEVMGKLEHDERSYLKGSWWRTLNRIMCVVGVLILGAIIALVVVATKMRPV